MPLRLLRRLLLALSLGLLPVAHAQDEPLNAYDFILDYAVPESPAFAALGVTPSGVLSGSAAKPLAVHFLDQFLTRGALRPDLALDVVPYVLAGGGFQSLDAYTNNHFRQLAANTQFSLGTASVEGDTASVRLGWGIRVSLLDARDPLRSRRWGPELQRRLIAALTPPDDGPIGEDEGEGVVEVPGLSAIYDEVIEEMRQEAGAALAAGFGQAVLVRGSVASLDSMEVLSNTAWVAGQWYTGLGFDFLGMLQGRTGPAFDDEIRIGVGVEGGTATTEVAGEVVYTTAAARFDYGLHATLGLLRNVKLVTAIGTMSEHLVSDGPPRLHVSAKVLYNLSEY